ncbi:MAG: PIG-L family deacetylase [Chloroflexota bacterium]
MARKRVLISYAHPDDESFGNGGLIGKYVAEGADVYLICATDGDVGTIPEEMEGEYESVRELRLSELHAANEILKFKEMFLFHYRDSGMMGSETSQDERSLWATWNREPESVTRRVVEVIREVKPQVIITFNKYGGYGHPDHIAIQRATTEAFKLAGDSSYITDGLQPYQPQKLYYSAIPSLMLKIGLRAMKLRGIDTRHMGQNNDIDFDKIVDNIEPVHTKIDIEDYLNIWDSSSACHKSQGGGGSGFLSWMPSFIRRKLRSKQTLTRIYPQPKQDRIDEHDLFENVTLDEPIVEPA